MKKLLSLFSFVALSLLIINGCTKINDLPQYDNGSAVTLSASKTSVAPTPADSVNKVVAFSWTSPNYATDTTNYKFIIEIDSTGRNFAKATKIEARGKLDTALTGRDLNAMLLN